jgi:hypothetical protein
MIDSEKYNDLSIKPKKCSFKFGEKKEKVLCFETRDILKKRFEGQMISRYPLEDWPYYPLPQNLMTFMFS